MKLNFEEAVHESADEQRPEEPVLEATGRGDQSRILQDADRGDGQAEKQADQA